MPDGNYTRTIVELEGQVKSNRPFWQKEPGGIPDDLRCLLGKYEGEAPRAPNLKAPRQEHCVGRGLRAPDTNAGADDVTYAALRLAPEEVAGAMAWTIKSWEYRDSKEEKPTPRNCSAGSPRR